LYQSLPSFLLPSALCPLPFFGNLTVNADSVELQSSNPLTIYDFVTIRTVLATGTFSDGDAGDLTINTRSLVIREQAGILAGTINKGRGGNITVNASEGVDITGHETLIIPEVGNAPANTGIRASTYRTDQAGDVRVRTPSLRLQDGAQMTVSNFGSGRSGVIEINAGLVEVRGSSPDGGLSKSSISAFNAGLLGRGVGGSININADKLIVRDAGRVNAESRGNGDTGNLQMTAKEILLDNGGRLIAATVEGERGNIFLNADSIIMRRGSNITTNATGNNTVGGNIRINTDVLAALENSHITANSTHFRGGNIINTQGLFGTALRVQPTPNSDITATGKNSFDFADKLNSMARQAAAERTAFAIKRFFDNCKAKKPGKKGYSRFQKNNRSVEYKTSGWKLSEDRKRITFGDKCNIGQMKLIGTWDLHFYQIKQIKRVRIVKRSDGYYVQFCVDAERNIDIQPTGKTIGLDVGLNHFYTDSSGNAVDNPRYLRKSEKSLKRLQKRVSRKNKGSNNRKKAINRLGRKHLKVSRQRKDNAIKQALCVVKSNDLVAFEKLIVKNMVKNSRLAKSISDVSWSLFTQWLEYFGKVYGRVVVPVAPQFTSQNCSSCGETVKKSLSVRTHVCKCGCVLDRDHNAAINILNKALKQTGYDLNTVGRTEIHAWGEMSLYSDLVTSLSKDTR